MITDIEDSIIIDTVVTSEGDIFLAAERLSKNCDIKVSEYELKSFISSNLVVSKALAERLRALLTTRMYYIVSQAEMSVLSSLDDMKPAEKVKTYAMLASVFHNLTVNTTKDNFDFDGEVAKAAAEFEQTPDEVKAELKRMQRAMGKR